MMTLVITGGIGSGKSLAADYFRRRGIPVYDCDSGAKELYKSEKISTAVAKALGNEVISAETGAVDTGALSAMVFGDPAKLALLEDIIHPALLDDIIAWRNGQKSRLVVLESAIFPWKPAFHPLADRILLVEADIETRIARVIGRSGLSREAVMSRIRAQQHPEATPEYDWRVLNDGTPEELEHELNVILKHIDDEN